jgi:hypothetical protein
VLDLAVGICVGLMVEDSNGDGSKATNNSIEDSLQSQLKYLSLDPAVFNDPNFPQARALDWIANGDEGRH